MDTKQILIDLTTDLMKLAEVSSKEAKRLNSSNLSISAGQEIAKIDAYISMAHLVMEKIEGLQNV